MERTAAERQSLGERGRMLADVANAIVQLHKRFYGKGPTKARAHLTHNVLVVVLEGGFTRGEETLREYGHEREVVQSRLAMQSSLESDFRTAVEQIVLRQVRSFMSANDPANDLQAEIFVLHPREGEDEEPLISPDGQPEALSERATRARERHHEVLAEHRALRAEQRQAREAIHRKE